MFLHSIQSALWYAKGMDPDEDIIEESDVDEEEDELTERDVEEDYQGVEQLICSRLIYYVMLCPG